MRKEYVAQVPLAEEDDMIKTFPPDRANQPFCHGERGAVGRSRMPIARSRRVKISP
jgi:hypothetical protein